MAELLLCYVKDIPQEVDQRKIGRDPATDKLNNEFEELLSRKHRKLENFVVTFSMTEKGPTEVKIEPKASPKPEPKPSVRTEPKPKVSAAATTTSKAPVASEYQTDEPLPSTKSISNALLPE